MFKTFENFAKFFCLNGSWVTEDCSAVYDLMSENKKSTLPDKCWPETILPQHPEEWLIFYKNIMMHLDTRNEKIKEIIK